MDLAQLPTLLFGGQTPRIEEYTDGDAYVVRAEIPGVDPQKDVKVSVSNGRLEFKIERTEERTEKAHSEFHYGSFTRSLVLPAGVQEEGIAAKYDSGILEIRIPTTGPAPIGREIPVELPGSATK
jgi:HSP20 family protein